MTQEGSQNLPVIRQTFVGIAAPFHAFPDDYGPTHGTLEADVGEWFSICKNLRILVEDEDEACIRGLGLNDYFKRVITRQTLKSKESTEFSKLLFNHIVYNRLLYAAGNDPDIPLTQYYLEEPASPSREAAKHF
jgi:hypothetical protein